MRANWPKLAFYQETLALKLFSFLCICSLPSRVISFRIYISRFVEVEAPMRTEYMFVIWSCIRIKGESFARL